MKKTIEEVLVNGIRKTVNRFRERPLNYFTESDIHSSLINDIKTGNSDILLYRDKKSNIEVSLIHNEYPTNFRYEKNKLKNGYLDLLYGKSQERKDTLINSDIGDRGNFDLSILNVEFVKKTFQNPLIVENGTKHNNVSELTEAIKHIINKDIKYTRARCVSLKEDINAGIYYARDLETNVEVAVEVKFIHPFNARNKDMLYEVIKDNTKLNLAKTHTDNYIRTVNLVFCSSEEKQRNDGKDSVISKIRDYISNGEVEDYEGIKYSVPEGIINIFIESYLNSDIKHTPKPIISYKNYDGTNDNLVKLFLEKL